MKTSKAAPSIPDPSSFRRDDVLHSRRLDKTQFRILGRHDRLNRFGHPCCHLRLGNLAGTASAQLDPMGFTRWWRQLQHGDVISVTGELRALPSHWYILLDAADSPPQCDLRPTAMMPAEWVLPAFLPQLKLVIRHWVAITDPDLRGFLASVFLETSTAMGFLNAPGSLRRHHAYQGGLLEHTADMLEHYGGTHPKAQTIAGTGALSDLCTTLIIIHDIGKTVTLVGRGRGAHQPHDMAALEILAEPLAQLETRSPVLANLIRGYFKPNQWYPRCHHEAYSVVGALDRRSADMPTIISPQGIVAVKSTTKRSR